MGKACQKHFFYNIEEQKDNKVEFSVRQCLVSGFLENRTLHSIRISLLEALSKVNSQIILILNGRLYIHSIKDFFR